MQIQLKQAEIEVALRDYISKQGITLQGRTVEIEFTSGRKENGISADLCISDLADDIPDFPSEQVQLAPKIALVQDSSNTEDSTVGESKAANVLNDVLPTVTGTTPTSLFGQP